MSCSDDKTIFVEAAFYGQFGYTCTQTDITCCPPNAREDCIESLEENQVVDWEVLKSLCDGQTSCSFDVQFATLSTCFDPFISDYMTVNYLCLPGKTEFIEKHNKKNTNVNVVVQLF